MRGYKRARLYIVLSLTLLLLAPNIHADSTAGEVEHELPDVCAPVREAEKILAQLQAPRNAHIDKKISSSTISTPGWGEGLGWNQDGPLSTTLRMLPRLLNFLSPSYLLSAITSNYGGGGGGGASKRGTKISSSRKRRVVEMLRLLEEGEEAECIDAYAAKAEMRMFPPKGIKQDLPASYLAYTQFLNHTSDPEAQFMVGMFHATGLGGVEQDQGKALLYYTFAALQGYRPAEMALGYRHWAGIGAPKSCSIALEYYEGAAKRSFSRYRQGPPGGLTLPLTLTRLTDRAGGIYGPHASWASSGANANRPAIRAASAIARGETEQEVLEFYQYSSDRDTYSFTKSLGRFYYLGSIYPSPGGIASGADGSGEIPQSYAKAKEYFTKVVRVLWPIDVDAAGNEVGKRKMSKEMEDLIREPAMVAAGYLGKMALRGEGGKPDYKRAKMWFERAAELGDRESLNGLGIMYRDGLLVNVDKPKAYNYFLAAAGQDLAEAQVNLAKLHLERGEITQTAQFLDAALRNHSPFEAFHYFASLHATTARQPTASSGNSGSGSGYCTAATVWYKMVAERGSWGEDFAGDAERAWGRGEESRAMVGWWIAGEMGYEVAQNNLAWLLEKGVGWELLQSTPTSSPLQAAQSQEGAAGAAGEKAMMWWMRSAGQDNVDAMVRVGDFYYKGHPTPSPHSKALAATYYQTAADTGLSSIAYWNLGWMYENGVGMKRDWWLAKRYYDLAGGNPEGYLPVVLSLVRLYLRSWWNDLRTAGAEPGLSFFSSGTDSSKVGLWARLKGIFTAPEMGQEQEEEWDDVSGAGSTWAQPGPDRQGQGQGRAGQGGEGGREPGELDFEDDILETLLILLVGFAVMGLVWVRQRWVGREGFGGGGFGGGAGVAAN